MLARMLQRHRDLVCISDLIEPVGDLPLIETEDVVPVGVFLDVLRAPSLPERIRYWRAQPTDELLHLPDCDEDVSLLLAYTLPFLAPDDPETLLVELTAALADRPPAPMAVHLFAAFAWLRDRFGGARWVERTGGSLPHATRLVAAFPNAKFVHLHRDPAEVAISMQTGSFFRLYRLLEADPGLGRWEWDEVPEPAELAAMVDQWEVRAQDAWRRLPADKFLQLSYERLMVDTAGELVRLVEFLLERDATGDDLAWAHAESATVRPAPLRRSQLSPTAQAALDQACARSRSLLGYA